MMNKQREGWKVVNRERKSAICMYTEGAVDYPANEIVTPREGCGPLGVFVTEEQAALFAWEGMSLKDREKCNPFQVIPCTYTRSLHRRFWYITTDGKQWPGADEEEEDWLPSGTDFADTVTCLE